MSVAEWDSSLSIGIAKVDLHNEQLFTVLCNLSKQMDTQSDYEIAQKLAELLDTYTFHIACEEIWTSRSKCSLSASHHTDHTRIRQTITEIIMNHKNDRASASVMIADLVDSFLQHIRQYDVEFAHPIDDREQSQLP